jgi:deoxyribonucleoside regulator
VTDELARDEFELLARVAHRYHLDGLTQQAIARELGLSRPKVQRLLDRARAHGVVDVHVEVPPWLHLDLERQLQQAFDLDAVIVATARADPEAQREEVARVGARYLERRLAEATVEATVVAVGHGRDAAELVRFFRPGHRLDCTFVSAMGGAPRTDAPTNPNEICRALADRCGGRAVSLYAPAFLATRTMRDQLVAEAPIDETLRLAARATVAVVGIGGTDDGCTMVRTGCFSLDEVRRLRRLGAVGDVLGNYVDASGRVIGSPETDRLVGLSVDALRAIRSVIAIVSEPDKPRAILGVLRAGVVRVLMVDELNARMVLALAQEPDLRPAAAVGSAESGE